MSFYPLTYFSSFVFTFRTNRDIDKFLNLNLNIISTLGSNILYLYKQYEMFYCRTIDKLKNPFSYYLCISFLFRRNSNLYTITLQCVLEYNVLNSNLLQVLVTFIHVFFSPLGSKSHDTYIKSHDRCMLCKIKRYMPGFYTNFYRRNCICLFSIRFIKAPLSFVKQLQIILYILQKQKVLENLQKKIVFKQSALISYYVPLFILYFTLFLFLNLVSWHCLS